MGAFQCHFGNQRVSQFNAITGWQLATKRNDNILECHKMANGSLFSNQWHLTQATHGPASGPLSFPSHGSSWPSARWQSSQWNLGWSSLCSTPWSHHSWPPAGTWRSGSRWLALHTWAAVDEVPPQPHGNTTHLHEVIRNFIRQDTGGQIGH